MSLKAGRRGVASKWVDRFGNLKIKTEIEQATGTKLGGVKAAQKTAAETAEVKIDKTTGKLYAPAGGGRDRAEITLSANDEINATGDEGYFYGFGGLSLGTVPATATSIEGLLVGSIGQLFLQIPVTFHKATDGFFYGVGTGLGAVSNTPVVVVVSCSNKQGAFLIKVFIRYPGSATSRTFQIQKNMSKLFAISE